MPSAANMLPKSGTIEGENMRPVTWCVVDEVKSGSWGIAGNPLTSEDVKALAAGGSA